MEVFAQTDNNMDLLNTEKGFRTTLFGFARDEVLAFIDQMMNNNAARNKQLNTTLTDMDAKLTELQEENEALLDKTRLLVDQLEEKRGDHIQNSRELENLQKELAEKIEIIEQLKSKLFSQQQEHNMSLSEIAALKKQIETLEDRLSDAKESSKCADDIIVTAQRAASKIMTEAVKQSPKPETRLNMPELSSIKDTIVSLEKQLRSVTETVEFALNSKGMKQDDNDSNTRYYNHTVGQTTEPEQTEGGWISAKIPQPVADPQTYWQPMERPTTPAGWQQPDTSYIDDTTGGVTVIVKDPESASKQARRQQNQVYYHRRSEAPIQQYVSATKVVRPTPVNYSQIRRQKVNKYIVTPHKKYY